MKFLDIKTDYAFKKVFGSENSKDILLSFLNSILDLDIVDLIIEDPYNVPKLQGMKDTAVDIKATLNDSTKVIIEMQILNHDGFESRILYNTAKNYANQLDSGDKYHLLNPVIALTIVNFKMFEFEKYKSSFKLLEKDNFTKYKDDIELVFIELPKINKELHECETIEEKWLYFIKNARKLDLVPKDIDKNLEKAFNIASTANMSKKEIELQEKREEFLFIQKNSIEKAKRDGEKQGLEEGIKKGLEKGLEQGLEKGLEQGLEKGLEQGKNQEKLKNAIVMVCEFGLDIKDVAKKLGLSESLIKENIK